MAKNPFKKIDFLILSIILLIAFLFRLYKINTPLADLHSWRQADTAAVARNFVREGVDLLHPRYDDLSGRESGRENPQGYRMVEFPLYNATFALAYKYLPLFSLDIYGRLTTVLFSLIIIAIVYFFLRKEYGRLAAIIGCLVYAIFPFFVFFSRAILPETTATSLVFFSIFFMYLYAQKNLSLTQTVVYFVLALVFFSLAILVKPTVIFYALPLLLLFFNKYGLALLKKFEFYLFFILSLLPFIIWRIYIRSYAEGIPASDWLITSVNTYQGLKSIFFRPAFFRWIFFERINNMIFGGYLTAIFFLGVLRKTTKFFFHSFLIAILLYLFIFQGGNVQHEYYQTIILPTLAMFVGLGSDFLISLKKNLLSLFISLPIILIVFAFSFFFSYFKVIDFYHYPEDLVSIARIIKTLTKPEDKIITDRSGDTTLLYLSDRKGWPAYTSNLDELKNKGYKYFVTAHKDLILEFKTKKIHKLVFENDQFSIFSL